MTRIRLSQDLKIIKYSDYKNLLDKIADLEQKIKELNERVGILTILANS